MQTLWHVIGIIHDNSDLGSGGLRPGPRGGKILGRQKDKETKIIQIKNWFRFVLL